MLLMLLMAESCSSDNIIPNESAASDPTSDGDTVMVDWDLRVSDNNRFLQYTDGRPFFWLGDTGWLLPERLDQGEADGYLNRCAQNGYNVVQVQTINGVPALNIYGQRSNNIDRPWDFSEFQGTSSSTYSYWDHMDYIIQTAAKYNIYIAMDCIWGGLVKSGLIDVEGAKAYGTFLAKRYKNVPNIVWMIGGDIQGDVKPEVWTALAETIKSIDHRHLMTYHPRGRYTSAHWWSGADWIDFHMYQSGHRKYGQRMGDVDYPIPDNTEEDCWMYVDSTWTYKPIKPVLDGEPSYEDIPKGLHDPNEERWQAWDVRRYAYWDVFGGAFGHTYGHNSIMQMLKPGYESAYGTDCKPWYEAQRDSGYTEMKYLKQLMLKLPFFTRVPDQSIIYKDNGTQYNRLIATRGDDYLLVYDYTRKPMNVDLNKISGTEKNLWLMNPQNGELTYLGKKSGKVLVEVPDTLDDAVLIAIDASKTYLLP